MIIEAVEHPILYQWPEGEVRLKPGEPIIVAPDRGLKIFKKCGPKVKAVQLFDVGAWLYYQVPGDPEEGPFEVVMVGPDTHQGGWWAVVAKKDSHVWIHEVIVGKVDRYK